MVKTHAQPYKHIIQIVKRRQISMDAQQHPHNFYHGCSGPGPPTESAPINCRSIFSAFYSMTFAMYHPV